MITMIGSLKGGSGKSTVTFNLGVWLSMAEVDIFIIDCDPQATLTDVAEVRAEEGFQPHVTVHNRKALTNKEDLHRHGEVLIDVGTANMEAVKKAITIADRIVVPVPPSQADIWSTQRFLRYVEANKGKNQPDVMGFINRGDTHHAVRESDEAAAALVSLPGIKFVRQRLCQRTVYRRSFSEGLAVFELEPRGKGSRELNALCASLYPDLVN